MSGTKTSTVSNAVDNWTEQDHPSTSRPAGTQLKVETGEARAYVYFGFPAPRGATITSAKLRLYTAGSFGGASPTISVQRAAAKYVNSKLNWNNAPAAAGTAATKTQSSTGDGDLWEIDVTAIMQAVSDGTPWYGFVVTSNSSTRRAFRAAQASAKRPTLVVTWSEAPDAPTTLHPSGGQAVNAAKPIVEMDYTDTSGSTTLAAVQVQIDAVANGFATPDFDSGTVVTSGSKARLDLSTTAFAGVSPGATVYWRGRVKDGAGLWSAWSAVASWSRSAKGTVTITSPSAGSPVLHDFTPPVLWTFSKTATKHRVIVDVDDGKTEVFDSGQVAGTDTQETIDGYNGKAVLQEGVTYVLTVQVWDGEDRVGTTDDPAYSEATQVFTVTPGAVTAPTGLAATSHLPPAPGLTLSFDRATPPDYFTVTKNGVVVKANIEPSDLFVSGTTYAYTFSKVRPNLLETYGVAAIVNGVKSPTTTLTASMKIPGVWLIDDDRTHTLFVAKTGGSTIALGEDAETLVPLGAAEGIRITQGLRGYEGNISGVLVGDAGKTLQQWVDNALWMRAHPGREFAMIVGSEAFDVVIGNLTVRPTGDTSPGMRTVSFDFWQTSAQRIPVVL